MPGRQRAAQNAVARVAARNKAPRLPRMPAIPPATGPWQKFEAVGTGIRITKNTSVGSGSMGSDASTKSKSANDSSQAQRSRTMAILKAHELTYEALKVPGQPPVPVLANELDRVLFNPGAVQLLKDPRTNVYNFDERLEHIVSIRDFDFTQVPAYVPAGKDRTLAQLASEQSRKYVGSTSSLTPILTHFHHALSNQRPPQLLGMSKYFPDITTTFTQAQRAPVPIYLRKDASTDTWSVNSGAISEDELILTLLGQAMETMLVTDAETFQNYTKDRSHLLKDGPGLPQSTYNYTLCGDFLMRSQLDCFDPRLPGTGMFDLKTRAVCAIRYDIDYAQIQDGSDYQIVKRDGQYESFTREFYELVRSALLKYSLQARIGRMDGIFVAYHNIRSLFGFEYLPLAEIDKIFHTAHLVKGRIGRPSTDLETQIAAEGPRIADAEFRLSIHALARVFDEVRERLPDADAHNIVVHCSGPGTLLIFSKPMKDSDVRRTPSSPPNRHEYTPGADPYPLLKWHRSDPEFIPPDMICLRVTLRSFINGEHVSNSRWPALPNASDTWEVAVRVYELTEPHRSRLYHETLPLCVAQELTSKPMTERTNEDDEIREQALKKLPDASGLQEWLRELEMRGRSYKHWDAERPKLRWKPASELDI